jgi:hypothetical protein
LIFGWVAAGLDSAQNDPLPGLRIEVAEIPD